MSFDYEGFAEEFTEEEKAARKEELKQKMRQDEELYLEIQNERMQEKSAAEQKRIEQEAYQEVLQELGISDQQFREMSQSISQENPDYLKQQYKQGVKNYLRSAINRPRDPVSGKYISKSEAQRRGLLPHQQKQQQPTQQSSLHDIDTARREGRMDSNEALQKTVESVTGGFFNDPWNQ